MVARGRSVTGVELKEAYNHAAMYLEGEKLPLEEIRDKVTMFGGCPLVVGDDTLIRVHVHTLVPDDVLEYTRSKGALVDIEIVNMDQQVQKRNMEK